MKNVWLLVFCLSLLADEFPFPTDSKSVSMATDSLGDRIAIWEEKGRILVSEKPLNGNWSIPSVLSVAMAEAASPQLTIDLEGKAVVTWVEGEKRKRASKSLRGEWAFNGEEDFSFRAEPHNLERKKKISPIKRTVQPMASAIDAPTGLALSGAQIGFTYGTVVAPTDGLTVAGQSLFRTSSNFVSGSVEIGGADRISFAIGGTKTATDGSSQAAIFLNPTYAPTSNTSIVTNVLSFPQFNPPMGVTITTGAHVYLQTGGQGGAGTVTNGYNLYVDNAGFGTNRYAAYFNGKVGIVTLTPQNNLDVSGAVAVGSYAGVNTAPSNGLIVSGGVGVGVTSLGNAMAVVSPTTANLYGLVIGGSTLATAALDSAYGMVVNTTMNGPTSGTREALEIYVNPLFTAGAGTTSNMYGILIESGTSTTNPQKGYGLKVNQPSFGATTARFAAWINGGLIHKITEQAANYTVTVGDYYVGITSTAAARTVTLPATVPQTGWTCVVKDESGGAATNNITVGGGGVNIDGAANFVINTNYGVVRIYSNGTQYYTW